MSKHSTPTDSGIPAGAEQAIILARALLSLRVGVSILAREENLSEDAVDGFSHIQEAAMLLESVASSMQLSVLSIVPETTAN